MFARHLVSTHQAQVLDERARRMRFAPTRSEEWLWRRLAGSRTGFAFRRQLVIGPFIVDFACTKLRLVVEIDGASHAHRERHDAHRDRVLASLGWSVLRITDHDVITDLDSVVARIIAQALSLQIAAKPRAPVGPRPHKRRRHNSTGRHDLCRRARFKRDRYAPMNQRAAAARSRRA